MPSGSSMSVTWPPPLTPPSGPTAKRTRCGPLPSNGAGRLRTAWASRLSCRISRLSTTRALSARASGLLNRLADARSTVPSVAMRRPWKDDVLPSMVRDPDSVSDSTFFCRASTMPGWFAVSFSTSCAPNRFTFSHCSGADSEMSGTLTPSLPIWSPATVRAKSWLSVGTRRMPLSAMWNSLGVALNWMACVSPTATGWNVARPMGSVPWGSDARFTPKSKPFDVWMAVKKILVGGPPLAEKMAEVMLPDMRMSGAPFPNTALTPVTSMEPSPGSTMTVMGRAVESYDVA